MKSSEQSEVSNQATFTIIRCLKRMGSVYMSLRLQAKRRVVSLGAEIKALTQTEQPMNKAVQIIFFYRNSEKHEKFIRNWHSGNLKEIFMGFFWGGGGVKLRLADKMRGNLRWMRDICRKNKNILKKIFCIISHQKSIQHSTASSSLCDSDGVINHTRKRARLCLNIFFHGADKPSV